MKWYAILYICDLIFILILRPLLYLLYFDFKAFALYFIGLDYLAGLVVRASALRVEDPGFEYRLHRDFSGGRVIPVT